MIWFEPLASMSIHELDVIYRSANKKAWQHIFKAHQSIQS